MASIVFTQYDEQKDRTPFFQMTHEYLKWINDSVYSRTGKLVFEDLNSYVEQAFPQFTSLKPPKGTVVILEIDGKPAGMGALKKLEESVGEIKRMYVRPEFRGNGYGRKILWYLEEQAREFGFSVVRLDTGALNTAALKLYESEGYGLRDWYEGSEASPEAGKLLNIIFMENNSNR
jgi:GNAT superfamily N-acetyltransferase